MKTFVFVQTDRDSTLFDTVLTANPPSGLYRKTFKRVMDVMLVLLALPIALPLIAICALLIARDGGNPFYSQLRIGAGGRSFRMWKLRTMVADAERLLMRHLDDNPEAALEWAKTQKLCEDPRITPVGRLLRKTSMDELPQLFNVLMGTMSLVGPRPMMEDQKALYPGNAYYRLRPGITGPWQISDRHTSAFAARARFDETYERELSLASDVAILWKTVSVVRRCTGV